MVKPYDAPEFEQYTIRHHTDHSYPTQTPNGINTRFDGNIFSISNTTKKYDKKELVGRHVLKINNKSVSDLFTEYSKYDSGNKINKQQNFLYYIKSLKYYKLLNLKSETILTIIQESIALTSSQYLA